MFVSDKLYSHGFKPKENEVIDLCNYKIEVHISSIGPKESIFQFLSLSSISFMSVGFIHSYTRQFFPIGEDVQSGMHFMDIGAQDLRRKQKHFSPYPWQENPWEDVVSAQLNALLCNHHIPLGCSPLTWVTYLPLVLH